MIPAATNQESRKRWLARMQAVRSRLQGRPDSEHEQALIRLGVGLVASAYLLWRGADSDNFVWAAIIPAVVYVFMAAATLLLVDIVIQARAFASPTLLWDIPRPLCHNSADGAQR